MLIREASEIMLNQSLKNCDQMLELIQPLKQYDIISFTYQRFNDIDDNKIRNITLLTDKILMMDYLNKIDQLAETSFVELQGFPLNKTTIFSPLEERYRSSDSNRSIDYKHGYRNILCLTHRDENKKSTEVFWFNSYNDDPFWTLQQLEHINVINQFILYFKDKMQKRIKNFMLSDKQLHQVSKHINHSQFNAEKNKLSDNTDRKMNLIQFPITHYYLEYPFKEKLTYKEFQILKYYYQNYSSKEIGRKLKLSPRTISKRLELLLEKSCCSNLKDLKKLIQESTLLKNL